MCFARFGLFYFIWMRTGEGGLASGRLTRSRRRHGGTESGFEVGLRAASSTFCLPRGTWGPIRTERSLAGSFKRAVQIRHEVIEMCVSQL